MQILQYEFISLRFYSEIQQHLHKIQKHCLVLPGLMQKMKKAMDHLTKHTIAKLACRSKTFSKLTNTCIIYENKIKS